MSGKSTTFGSITDADGKFISQFLNKLCMVIYYRLFQSGNPGSGRSALEGLGISVTVLKRSLLSVMESETG
jgi:hypothetical protein